MSRKSLMWILMGALAVSFGALVVPDFIRARNTPASNACVNNLRIIQGAKEQWGLENHKASNEMVALKDLRPYMGRGIEGELPHCPEGGIYTPGRLGEPPTCSIGGPQHSLDYDYAKENRYRVVLGSFCGLSFLGLLVALFLSKKTKGQDRGAMA